MNVLQILPELNVGGVETGVIDLAKHLTLNNHKVIVVSSGGKLLIDLDKAGIKHYEIDVQRKSLFGIISAVPKLVKIIKDEKIQIVHARSRVPALIAFLASLRVPVVFITTCHGYYKKHLFSRVMGLGKYVICPSNIIASHMVSDFGVKRENIKIINRGVDLTRFEFISPDQKDRKDFTMGIIGRLTPLKGHAYFLKAASKLVKFIPNLRVWIVGDASRNRQEYKDELKLLCRRLGIFDNVDFLGHQKDINSILSRMNCLVLSTVTEEAFGRVIIEAQAAGVPVVATRVGGVIDIIEDGKTGILVSPADADAISDAVKRIYDDEQLAKDLAENGRKGLESRFNLDRMYHETFSVYREALEKGSILVIKLTALGDVILSIPSLRELRKKFPNHKIYLLVSKDISPLFLSCPYIDEIIVDDRKLQNKGIFGFLSLIKKLISIRFDMSIDLQNNRRSHLIAFLGLIPQRHGFNLKKKFSFLLNNKTNPPKEAQSPLKHQLNVLNLIGINEIEERLELWVDAQAKAYVEDLLNKEWVIGAQGLVGINIGASSRWESKCWPEAHIVKLCEQLKNINMRVILTGTKSDHQVASSIVSSVKDFKPINACGKTDIAQLVALISKCSVFITGDSAPLHIASGLGIPLVALFGPTDPARHVQAKNDFIVLKKILKCSPCYKSKCGNNICLKTISVQEVFEAVKKLIKQ